jgi:hypothetical protein
MALGRSVVAVVFAHERSCISEVYRERHETPRRLGKRIFRGFSVTLCSAFHFALPFVSMMFSWYGG